jgi:ribosomal protein S18 acetylase RimI-like enzyme
MAVERQLFRMRPLPREVIRRARLSDAQAIAAVHVSVSRKTYADLLPGDTFNQFSVERRARQWRRTIEMPDSTDTAVFVAEDTDNTIVGFGCCSRQRYEELAAKGFTGEFQSIYVLPSAQGRGVGRTLMAAMARYLSSLSISGATCWTLRDNEGARRFYEALGAEVVDEQACESGTGTVLIEVAYGWLRLGSLSGE